jgi:hypothetical protein
MLSIMVLVVVAVGFAWNLGVHYTGAVMGMPYAARSIALWPALVLIALLTILGATIASSGVEATVGQHLISDRSVSIPDAIVIVLSAGLLTLLYNYQKIPTSTIQILIFCVVGVALAGHLPIYWATIGKLVVVWVCAPLVAFGLGFLFTRLLGATGACPCPNPGPGWESREQGWHQLVRAGFSRPGPGRACAGFRAFERFLPDGVRAAFFTAAAGLCRDGGLVCPGGQ